MDTLEYFDFNVEKCKERAKRLNPDISIFPVSAKTGQGMDSFETWLKEQVGIWKS